MEDVSSRYNSSFSGTLYEHRVKHIESLIMLIWNIIQFKKPENTSMDDKSFQKNYAVFQFNVNIVKGVINHMLVKLGDILEKV